MLKCRLCIVYSVHFSTPSKRPNKPSAVWLDFDLYASQVEAHHQSISIHTVHLVVNLWAEDNEVIIICHLKGQALGKSPLRALFTQCNLPVTCRTQYVINTLSCCCSVTILMAARPGSLGHLLCLNNIRKKVALFFFYLCVKSGEAAQTLLCVSCFVVLFNQSF